MMKLHVGLASIAVYTVIVSAALFAAEDDLPNRRRVFALTDMSRERTDGNNLGLSDVIDLMEQAKTLGYNGIVLYDWGFGSIDKQLPSYRQNVRRLRRRTEQLEMELIPTVMPNGGSILANDPNLAEGVPVKNARFVVREVEVDDGVELIGEIDRKKNELKGGGFEIDHATLSELWSPYSSDGHTEYTLDSNEKLADEKSLKFEHDADHQDDWGIKQIVRGLKPWHQYHFRIAIKTANVTVNENDEKFHGFSLGVMVNPFEDWAKAKKLTDVQLTLAKETDPDHTGGDAAFIIRKDQDWTHYGVVINTFAETEVRISLDAGAIKSGTVWLDELRLQEIGGFNLVRRRGCPLQITNLDASMVYEEGRDFHYWRDPKTDYHDVTTFEWTDEPHLPPPIAVAKDSRIEGGQLLNVSYYHSLPLASDGTNIAGCLRHPKVFRLYANQIRQVDRLLGPKTWLMDHDEIRVAGQCRLCNTKESVGEILAGNVARCAAIIRDIRPSAEVWVWNDMFDPYHNAVDETHEKSYFPLVRDSYHGSWQGLPEYVRIVNWNSTSDASLNRFEARRHRQLVAGFYDSENFIDETKQWLRTTQNFGGLDGVMYSTYERNYDHLAKFMEELVKAGN